MPLTDPSITMPHRYKVRYDDRDLAVDFDTEPADGALIFYAAEAQVVSGVLNDPEEVRERALAWLQRKFRKVEVDW